MTYGCKQLKNLVCVISVVKPKDKRNTDVKNKQPVNTPPQKKTQETKLAKKQPADTCRQYSNTLGNNDFVFSKLIGVFCDYQIENWFYLSYF